MRRYAAASGGRRLCAAWDRGIAAAQSVAERDSHHLQGSSSFVNLPDLQHFRAALCAPRADNRMNPSATQAEYIQSAAERIRFTLVLPLRRMIFYYHNDFHNRVLLPGR